MDQNDRNDAQRPGGQAGNGENVAAGDPHQDAPAGSSELNSSPPTNSISENPVNRIGRHAGDVLADEVREGQWNSAEEKRDDLRGS